MRTIAEIEALLLPEKELPDISDQDAQYDRGVQAGFKKAIRMIEDGKTTPDILEYARADSLGYVSHGDDYADAWQSGYSTALYWAAEQYDWDEEGVPIFREGNIWGEPS